VAEEFGVEGVDAGVHFGDGADVVGGVFFFDDAHDFAVGGADDTAVAAGCIHGGGEHGDGCAGFGVVFGEQAGEGVTIEHRHVGGGDQDSAVEILGEFCEAAGDGVTGAVLLFLGGGGNRIYPVVAQGGSFSVDGW
jgi:hypothetical protein